ncbi:MAG: glycosyltransferase family 4 protein [Actinobacteria bacterium]|nr:MAG: glycosyltransferase family 4 protein [Actinomycetota bacterium]
MRPATSSTSCQRSSRGSRAQRRRSRSRIPPRRGRRPGRQGLRCSCCRSCLASDPIAGTTSCAPCSPSSSRPGPERFGSAGSARSRRVGTRALRMASFGWKLMNDKLRIAVLSPVWFAVPPTGYGGIELVVSLLADGLADAGHEVTLFASGDSLTKANLSYIFEEAPSELIGRSLPELRHALACYTRADEFDVINDHSGIPAAALGGLLSTPVLHTVHGPLDTHEAQNAYESIAEVSPSVGLISISENQRRSMPDLPWAATIPNAIDLSLYPSKPHRGDYLLFLGRFSPDKGAHRAIAVAMELGLPLKMAGKNREQKERQYFAEYVEPHVGNNGIEYLGEVTHGEKVELLQDARATLFPIEWEEPFGLVMVESMACGTPVIATRHGAVPEVIHDGRSGIIVENFREMAAALDLADELDPTDCRAYVEERFAPERMVRDYVNAYAAALSQ